MQKVRINNPKNRNKYIQDQLIEHRNEFGVKQSYEGNQKCLLHVVKNFQDENIPEELRKCDLINKYPQIALCCDKHYIALINKFMIDVFCPDYKKQLIKTQICCNEDNRIQNLLKNNPNSQFIFKPDSGSQGKGIKIIKGSNQKVFKSSMLNQSNCICQKYISNVLTIDGYKFDLRLQIALLPNRRQYIAFDGLARLATSKQSKPNSNNDKSLNCHLTNQSLNKGSDQQIFSEDIFTKKGSKRLVSVLFRQLEEAYSKDFVEKIKLNILKTLSVQVHQLDSITEYGKYMILKNNETNCFQLLGYDILIDKNGNAHCLEVNASPSLNLNHSFKLENDQIEMIEKMELPENTYNPKKEELTVPSSIDIYLKTNILNSTIELVAKMSKSDDIQSQYKCLNLFASGSDHIDSNKLKVVDIDLSESFDGQNNDNDLGGLPLINQLKSNNNVLNKFKVMKEIGMLPMISSKFHTHTDLPTNDQSNSDELESNQSNDNESIINDASELFTGSQIELINSGNENILNILNREVNIIPRNENIFKDVINCYDYLSFEESIGSDFEIIMNIQEIQEQISGIDEYPKVLNIMKLRKLADISPMKKEWLDSQYQREFKYIDSELYFFLRFYDMFKCQYDDQNSEFESVIDLVNKVNIP